MEEYRELVKGKTVQEIYELQDEIDARILGTNPGCDYFKFMMHRPDLMAMWAEYYEIPCQTREPGVSLFWETIPPKFTYLVVCEPINQSWEFENLREAEAFHKKQTHLHGFRSTRLEVIQGGQRVWEII